MNRHSSMSRRVLAVVAGLAIMAAGSLANAAPVGGQRLAEIDLTARVVAVGVAEASAISAVGTFLPGGPIHDNPAFAAYTLPGRVLDPVRILVASRSNFGAPVANPDWERGALLSIDPRGESPLAVPPHFAASGGQASTLGGRVQMFSSQSRAFLNGNNNPQAVTAAFTGVSNPVGLSINNAFGRLWPANVLDGLDGIGSSTILDPTGIPLAGAPNTRAGGVFAGKLTPVFRLRSSPARSTGVLSGLPSSAVPQTAPGERCSASCSPTAASSRCTARRPSTVSRPSERSVLSRIVVGEMGGASHREPA
jgi:hypothetical protein